MQLKILYIKKFNYLCRQSNQTYKSGYLRGKKTTGTFNDSTVGTFTADYTKSAVMPGIAVRFSF